MGLSFSLEEGDGFKTAFPFTFVGYAPGYIRESDVHVFVRNSDPESPLYNELEEVTDNLLFPSPNVVQLQNPVEAPIDGINNIMIRRIMPKDEIYADINSDAVFRKTGLNNSFIQMLYTQHEALDGFYTEGGSNAVIRIDELFDITDRCLKVPVGDSVTDNGLVISEETVRANKVLGFDGLGQVIPVEITDGTAMLTFQREKVVIVDEQVEYTLAEPLSDQSVVYIDGRMQHATDNVYSITVDGNLLLSEPLDVNQSLEVWYRALLANDTELPLGARGRPYPFDTVADMVDNYSLMQVGDWAETYGKDVYLDKLNAQYFLVENSGAGTPDGYFIVDLVDKKGVLMYNQSTSDTESSVDSVPTKLRGVWGNGTLPVANYREIGDTEVHAIAYVNNEGSFVTVDEGGKATEYFVSATADDSKSPAIEWGADGVLTAFTADSATLNSLTIDGGKVVAGDSTLFPNTIKDIQVHRAHNSMYIFVSTGTNGLYCVNYKQGVFGTPFLFSDFEVMRSKSLYEDDIEKAQQPTIKVVMANEPDITTDKAYFINFTFTPTPDGIGSLVGTKADGTVVATITPTGIDVTVDDTNSDLMFTAQASHTIVLGDISREELNLIAIAEMPIVSGFATFDVGYSYNLTLLHYVDSMWISEIAAPVVGLEGFDAFAPQLDSVGTPTGSYGIEGSGYKPLGICFADLETYEIQDDLADQRKIAYVTHAGNTYDLRTLTVTTERFWNGINTLASDNPRIAVRDNNKPIYRPRSYLNSKEVTIAYADSDSNLGIADSRIAIEKVNTRADVQAVRDANPVTSLLTLEEAESLVASGSVGQSGGSWWTYPTTIGRVEDGKDVVYVTGTYGVTDNSRDDGLAIKGSAVQFIASLTWDDTALKYVLDKRQLLDIFIVDEHDAPAVTFQKPNGEMIISCNSHADTLDVLQEWSSYTFGKNIRTLGLPNVKYHRALTTYSQMLSTHFTTFHVHRVNDSGWGFNRITKTGFPEDYSQMFYSADNYYVLFAELDKETTQGAGAVNKYHCFIAANPIDDLKADIKYLEGNFEVGKGIVLRDQANVVKFEMTGNDTPITDTDFDVAVSEDPNTRRVRLLDVAYREEPRILYQSMPKSDDLINRTYVEEVRLSVKDVELTDLRMAWWNGASWQNVLIKADIQGGLGYDPVGDVHGVTWNANAYFYGACFHAGSDHTNSLDTIYFVWKNPNDTFELRSINFNPTTGAVSNEQTLYTSDKILYRPKMVQGGNRRVLFFYEADDWWSYTTYSAVTRFIDLT